MYNEREPFFYKHDTFSEADETEIVVCKLKVKLDHDAKLDHASFVGDYTLSSPSEVNGKQRTWTHHGNLLRGIDIRVRPRFFDQVGHETISMHLVEI